MMKRTESGFTLVELAIVLMIIGLLIGGILRGQELMNNARLGATIKQVTSYVGALATFRDGYGMFPGDMVTAQNRLKGCDAGNSCVNGNGNGVVGTATRVWIGGQQAIGTENTQFWKHLALTNIITGIDVTASTPEWGRSNPVTPVGGGFSVVTTTRDPADPTGSPLDGSLVLRMHGSLQNPIVDQSTVVTPKQAAYIDRKMDDGIPNKGDVQAQAAGILGGSQADCENAYNETREDIICVMAFLLNR